MSPWNMKNSVRKIESYGNKQILLTDRGTFFGYNMLINDYRNFPIMMDRANDVMTLIAEGKFNPNTLAYKSLREEKLKLELMRNKILGGVLVLVIFVLLVFK